MWIISDCFKSSSYGCEVDCITVVIATTIIATAVVAAAIIAATIVTTTIVATAIIATSILCSEDKVVKSEVGVFACVAASSMLQPLEVVTLPNTHRKDHTINDVLSHLIQMLWAVLDHLNLASILCQGNFVLIELTS
jgi:hypothetical protein